MAKEKETHDDDNIVQVVIESMEVFFLQFCQLQNFLNAVEEEKGNQEELGGHDEVVVDAAVANQLHPGVERSGKDATCSRELKDELAHTEEVDVGVVHGEVDGEQPFTTLKPAVVFEICEQGLCHILSKMEVLDVTSTLVRCQFDLQTKLMITGSRLANIFRWAYAIQGRKQCLICLKIMVN